MRMGNGKLTWKIENRAFFPHSAFSTLRIFHTPHFPHSAFSTLRIFYTPHSALRTPYIPPNPNYPTNWLRTLSEDRKASRVEMSSRARTHTISSGESSVFRVFRGITKRLTQRKKWLIRWTKEKISSVQSSQLCWKFLPIQVGSGFTLKWTAKLW